MRKSRFVARVSMVVFCGLILLSVILAWNYRTKMKEWGNMGKETIWEGDPPVQVTIHRDPANRNADTRTYTDSTYRKYVFGRTVTGDDITDKILSDPKTEVRYDADGHVIEVFVLPDGKAAPFKAEEFLMKFAQNRWCLIPTMEAAIYASWIWFWKWFLIAGLVISLVVWLVARWVSNQPLKVSSGRGGRGSRGGTYKGNPIKRFFRWVGGRRSGGRGSSRGRGRGRGRR